jgi:uncharacterized protein YjbJ (UPF0337 family)
MDRWKSISRLEDFVLPSRLSQISPFDEHRSRFAGAGGRNARAASTPEASRTTIRIPVPTDGTPRRLGRTDRDEATSLGRKRIVPMHKDEIKGAAKDAKGSMKEAAGKATGDERMRAEGAVEKAEGKMQKGLGKIKDAARDALKH